ncbi:RES family NAD+ phosphorylase [Rhodopila sp.]|uniref:RES family NAD+ phosphorylase n=1 Tax=Rhodopila sp. TaxID=2480087 RepID=UPI003D124DD8
MLAWRLCRRAYADLSGEGARRFGGRWNSAGRPLVYLAEHPALAALEMRVHLDLPFELLPVDYVLMQVVVPDNPDRVFASAADRVETGDMWLTEAQSCALLVPSVLVPHSWNVLLNPRHPDAGQAAVHTIEAFGFDPRLWRPLAGEG